MNETQKRIAAYQAALPGLKERVLAVLLLLAMSAAMLTSASFAWLTISQAPEITNVSTTLAANGNLEIALVQPNGEEPGTSQIGDSSAALNQSVVNANLTWGNLVNLSDPSYGLSNLVLRPALLGNTNNLLSQPLKGVDYGEDGRVQLYYNEDYQFSNWTIESDGTAYFKYNTVPKYGVRAISTIEYTYVNNRYYDYSKIRNTATGIRDVVVTNYDAVTSNKSYINALAGLIGQFMTDQLNERDTDVSEYVTDMYHMLLDVYELMAGAEDMEYCFEDALAELANAQVYLHYPGDTEKYNANRYTKETLLAATSAELAANGVSLDCLAKYKTLKAGIRDILFGTSDTEVDCLYDYYYLIHWDESTGALDESYDNGTAVLRSQLMTYVNRMVDIASTKITCDGETNTVAQLTASKSKALGVLGKKVDGEIVKGYLKDFEQIVGGRLYAENVVVSAYYITTVSITARSISTAAAQPYEFDKDVEAVEAQAAADKGEYTGVAQDTYGMALDFWVRTNATDSYLILEGNVLMEYENVRSTGIDINGNVVELWTANVSAEVTDDQGNVTTASDDYAVYPITDDDGNQVWRYASNHALLYNADGSAPEGQTISAPIQRYEKVGTVVGYEGENRVWDTEDNIFLDVTNTTQGNGSCYVFYAEDPAQQENSLRLLSNLRVAFVDSNTASATYGKMVAIAKLDIDNRYEENGKVTVPLVLTDDGSSYLTTTSDGTQAIMPLQQNVATRLTAIVYLDGREISNAEVLSASDIHGQLNIQFGSTTKLQAVSDEKLESETRSISAVIKTTGQTTFPESNKLTIVNGVITSDADVTFSYDDASDDNPMIVDVKVTVTGDSPSQMTAFFMRKVNATQGSREVSFPLIESETEPGVWTGQYTFTVPGEYVLRTVQLDGVDYELPSNNYPRVVITGFGIERVTMKYDGSTVTGNTLTILTGERSISTALEVKLASDQRKMPSSVRLQYLKDDGTQVTANMSYNSTDSIWTGTANFTSSGVYTLRYIIMDGEYTELDANYQKSLDISMGITVKVIDGAVNGESLRNTTWEGEPFSVPMYVEIYNDNDEELRYLSGVKLVYARGTSEIDDENPTLDWNTSEDRYVGYIQVPGPGVYTFKRVVVGGDSLTKTVNTPPTFTCLSPEPPAYYDAQPMEDMDYLLSTGSNTYSIGVRLKNAAGATVTPYINGEPGTPVNAKSTDTINGEEVSVFEFVLPTNDAGYQSGEWTITGLKLTNVYTTEGETVTLHDENNPLIWDLVAPGETGTTTGEDIETSDDLHVKVVNVVVSLQNDTVDNKPAVTDETLIGGYNEETAPNGVFMGTATATKNIRVIVTDQNGNALDSNYVTVTAPQITYQYQSESSVTHGGYYSTAEDSLALIELTGTPGEDGKTYTMPLYTFTYAGQYNAYLMTFNVSGGNTSQTFSYTSEERYNVQNHNYPIMDMPVYILETAKPTVTISSVSAGSSTDRYYTSATPGATEYNSMITGAFNKKLDDYNAVVYMYFAEVSNYDNEAVEIKYPTVTLGLEGIPTGHSGVTMVFGNAADSSSACTFTFAAGKTTASSSQTAGNRIGGGVNGTYDYGAYIVGAGIDTYPVLYTAGKQTVSQITVQYNNATYTVNLSAGVTINNPLYPYYTDFAVNNSTFTGTVPGRIYATPQKDGTFEVTLPGSQTWTEDKSSTTNGDFVVQSGYPSTRDVYTERSESNGCSTTTYYTPYIETTTVSKASSSTTTWTRTWTITGWKVGNTTYGLGETITITGNQTVQAVLAYTDGAKTTTSSTTTRTVIAYTQNGEESPTKPTGSKVTSVSGSTTDVVS